MKYEDTLEGALNTLRVAIETNVAPLAEGLQRSISEAVNSTGLSTTEAINSLKKLGGNACICNIVEEDDQTHYLYSPIEIDEEIVEQTRPETSAETDNPNKKCLLENSNLSDWYDNFMKNL